MKEPIVKGNLTGEGGQVEGARSRIPNLKVRGFPAQEKRGHSFQLVRGEKIGREERSS